jgi:hypothetical protein
MERFYIPAYGPDDEAVTKGLSWLFVHAQDHGGRGALAVPTMSNLDFLEHRVGAGSLRQLRRDKYFDIPDPNAAGTNVRISIFTEQGGERSFSGGPVLALWVSGRFVERLDRMDIPALCIVSWTPEDVEPWAAGRGAINATTGNRAASSTIDNRVVERALNSLNSFVNLSSGLNHPSDEAQAYAIFQVLKDNGETFDPQEVYTWALHHRWRMDGANELKDIAERVRTGKDRRSHRNRLRPEVIDRWRQESD